jgi:MFS family permease
MTKPQPGRLLTGEFAALNLVFFLAAAVMALFFQFQHYLQSLSIPSGWFGFLIGADSLASFVLQPVLAVRLNGGNSRRWIVFSLFGMAVALFAYSFAFDVATLAIVRIIHGAAFVCLVSAIMAMITVFIPQEKSGRAFGLISVIRLLPYSIIPPLVGLIGDQPADFRHILIVAGAVMLLSSLMVFAMKPALSEVPAGPASIRRTNTRDLITNLKDRKVATLLGVQLLLYTSYTIVFFFLKEYAHGQGIENPGLFFTIATAAMIGVRVMGSAFFDRFNKAIVTGLALAGLAASYGALGALCRAETFYVLALVMGLGWGIAMPVVIALIFDVSEPHCRGMNLNLSLLVMQGGFFLGPFAGGFIVSRGGYGPLFMFTTAISLIAAGLVTILSRRGKL